MNDFYCPFCFSLLNNSADVGLPHCFCDNIKTTFWYDDFGTINAVVFKSEPISIDIDLQSKQTVIFYNDYRKGRYIAELNYIPNISPSSFNSFINRIMSNKALL
jgi:hypothetical protein